MNYDFRTTPPIVRSLDTALNQIENAQLARRVDNDETAYLFKHALVQDSAYASLTKHERKRLHGMVGAALEALGRESDQENASLLAFHFEQAENRERALTYLQRAAEAARRAVAHREQLALLARAVAIAERLDKRDLLADLHLQRGKAFGSITQFADARAELTQALTFADQSDLARRAEILVTLAITDQWRQEIPLARVEATQAQELAQQVGRNDLVASAISTLAMIESVDGDVRASVAHFNTALELAGDTPSAALLQGMEISGLSQYWLGNARASLERNRHAVELAQRAGDTVTIMRGLSNTGMALWASGQYGEALTVFAQARTFGEEHDLGAWRARQLAIEGGMHLEFYDFAGAEQLSLQAQALARTYKFLVATVSPAVDLLFNYARSGHLEKAARVEVEIRAALPGVTGAHNWLLGLRYLEARAEFAAARQEWALALALADESLSASQKHGRVKYEASSLQTRARVLVRLDRREEAMGEAQKALALARGVGDPLMFVRAALTVLEMEPDEALAAEMRSVAHQISQALPDADLRKHFETHLAAWI